MPKSRKASATPPQATAGGWEDGVDVVTDADMDDLGSAWTLDGFGGDQDRLRHPPGGTAMPLPPLSRDYELHFLDTVDTELPEATDNMAEEGASLDGTGIGTGTGTVSPRRPSPLAFIPHRGSLRRIHRAPFHSPSFSASSEEGSATEVSTAPPSRNSSSSLRQHKAAPSSVKGSSLSFQYAVPIVISVQNEVGGGGGPRKFSSWPEFSYSRDGGAAPARAPVRALRVRVHVPTVLDPGRRFQGDAGEGSSEGLCQP